MSTMPASVGPVALAKLTRSDIHHVLQLGLVVGGQPP
jgi:hypothetical protein